MKPPIIVVAPTRRCGTTLLQRALNSTGAAIIYGENFIFLESLPQFLASTRENWDVKVRNTSTARDRLLAGEYDFEASMLFPDYVAYAKVMRENIDRIYRYYEDAALGFGYDVWGIKSQIRRLSGFVEFMRIYPKAKYVFVYRNIVDAARSEKARFGHEYKGPAAWAAFAETWSQNVAAMRARQGPNFLHVEYADMAADAAGTIAKMEAFCGVGGIRPEVFERKVNVTPVLDRLNEDEKASSYRPPAELTDAEQKALLARAAETCRRFGYAIPA